jgi:hypothetical protein
MNLIGLGSTTASSNCKFRLTLPDNSTRVTAAFHVIRSEDIREITIVVHSEYLGDLTFFHLFEHQLPQGSHTSGTFYRCPCFFLLELNATLVMSPPLRKEQQAVADNQCILRYSSVFSKGECY